MAATPDAGGAPGGGPPRLSFTRPITLAVAAAAGAGAALVLLLVSQRLVGHPPMLAWSGPLVLFFAAALVGTAAFTTWRRLQVRRERIESQRAVMFLALGKASAVGGAALAAGYVVFVIASAGNLDAIGPQQRVLRGALSAVAAGLLGAAGLWLERACRVPDSGVDDENSDQEL